MARVSIILRKNSMDASESYILNISDNYISYNLYTCKNTYDENL